jgi:phosphate-selective porin
MKRLLNVALVIACAAAPAAAQDKTGLVWNDRPSIVFGEDVSVDLKGRALMEWRTFDPAIGEDTFHLRTARVGLAGELTRHFEWEIEREIGEVEQEDGTDQIAFGEWKDVAIEWKTFDKVRVIGGRFKMPFGLEQTTDTSRLKSRLSVDSAVLPSTARDSSMIIILPCGSTPPIGCLPSTDTVMPSARRSRSNATTSGSDSL